MKKLLIGLSIFIGLIGIIIIWGYSTGDSRQAAKVEKAKVDHAKAMHERQICVLELLEKANTPGGTPKNLKAYKAWMASTSDTTLSCQSLKLQLDKLMAE